MIRQMTFSDLQWPEMANIITDINILESDYWEKNQYCRQWEYAWILSNIFSLCRQHAKWLDIGPGGSIIPFYLKQKGFDVTVIEGPEFEAYFTNHGIPFVSCEKVPLPFMDASFDVITSISVFEHVVPPADKELFDDCRRLLKPNGVFGLTTEGWK